MNNKVQQILRRDITPEGVTVQIEDWKEVYPEVEKTIKIAAYPVAKNGGYWVRRGESFRLDISRGFSTDAEVEYIYNGLVNGDISLEDLSEHYWNGDKDKYYMGMEVQA